MVIVAVIMMLVLGAVLGLGLGVADKYLKVEADVRVEKVTSLLPGYNCGGCGYAGCDALAKAIAAGEAPVYPGCVRQRAPQAKALKGGQAGCGGDR